MAVRTVARVVSGHSAIDHASDRFPDKIGHSQVDGARPSLKVRCPMGRSSTPDPERPSSIGINRPGSQMSCSVRSLNAGVD